MIPDTGISKIVGLLQIVSSNGGRMELDDISKAYQVELESLLLAVDGAEMLGFVKMEASEVRVTPLGKKLVAADIPRRKKLIKKQMREMELFKVILSQPKVAAREKIHKKHFISMLAKYYSKRDADRQFRKIVEWGRYAQLVSYDADTEEVQITA